MPAVDHLQWFDIDDFTAGLWDEVGVTAQLLAPPKAFSVLQDYEPRPGGGLRAFYQGSTLSTVGLDDTVNERITALFTTNKAGSSANDDDRYLLTIGTDFKARAYRWALPDGGTQWSRKYIDGAAASSQVFNFGSFVGFVRSDLTKLVLFVKRCGSTQGVYQWTDGDVVTNLQSATGPLAAAQGKVLMCEGGNIHYSDNGVQTFTSFANQVIKPSQEKSDSVIAMLSENAPADILIATQHAPWYLLTGDILSPTVRAMGDEHHARGNHAQDIIRVPQGLAFIEPGGKVFVTDGHQFQSLSDPIRRFAVDYGPSDGVAFGVGRLAWANDYLFAPGGYVYDFKTKAWFKQSFITNAIGWAASGGKAYLCTSGSTPQIATFVPYENSNQQADQANRVTTAMLQTVPYADQNGRNIDVKEIQIFAYSYAASEFKVELIDETGASVSTRYQVAATAGRDVLKFQFPATKSDYLSCKVTTRSVSGTHEAPTIERLRIGFGLNNLIRGG